MTETDHADVIRLPFERAIEELESIVKRLEEGKVPLEESVAIYERGEALKRRCEELLRLAEARVEKITLDAAGKPTGTEPLDVKCTRTEDWAMSFFPGKDPALGRCPPPRTRIDLVVVPRSVDVGHFAVRRALPHAQRRMVGPFIFFDHFGPAEFHSGQGIDVRPHPHIGLATVTYLFDGEIMHRDSLGTAAAIRPGRGQLDDGRARHRAFRAHRARAPPRRRADPWAAVLGRVAGRARRSARRASRITTAPSCRSCSENGKTVRVVAGEMYGARSPVETLWETLFADVDARRRQRASLRRRDARSARLYLVSGEVEIAGDRFAAGPAAGVPARRSRSPDGATRAHRVPARRRGHGRPASHLVEFRLLAQGAHRAGQGRLEARPLRHRAGRRERVHSAAGVGNKVVARMSKATSGFSLPNKPRMSLALMRAT